jgi:hypothetical protein
MAFRSAFAELAAAISALNRSVTLVENIGSFRESETYRGGGCAFAIGQFGAISFDEFLKLLELSDRCPGSQRLEPQEIDLNSKIVGMRDLLRSSKDKIDESFEQSFPARTHPAGLMLKPERASSLWRR